MRRQLHVIHIGAITSVFAAPEESVDFLSDSRLQFALPRIAGGMFLVRSFGPWVFFLLGRTALLPLAALQVLALRLHLPPPPSRSREGKSAAHAYSNSPRLTQLYFGDLVLGVLLRVDTEKHLHAGERAVLVEPDLRLVGFEPE